MAITVTATIAGEISGLEGSAHAAGRATTASMAASRLQIEGLQLGRNSTVAVYGGPTAI